MFKKLEKLKMKGKLTYGYVLVIGLMAFISIVAIVGMFLINSKMNYYIKGSQAADTAVKSCRIYVNVAARNIREMALNDDKGTYDGYIKEIQKNIENLSGELDNLKKADVLDSNIYNKYSDSINEWIQIGNKIMEQLQTGNKEEAVRMIFEECTPALQAALNVSKEIDTATDELKKEALSENTFTITISIIEIIVLLLLAIGMAYAVEKRIISSILTPLLEIENAAIEMSKGNLHNNLTYHSNDEMGRLAHSLRSSIHTLSEYIEDIDRAMKEFSEGNFDVKPNVDWKGDFVNILDSFMHFEKKMAETVKNIQRVSNQVTDSSEQVSQSSGELASGATEQAGIIEELTATVEDVSVRIRNNADNAKIISKDVEAVGVEIINSNGKMQEMVKSMNEISDSSHEISKIIATINDIASQTNLLALNASIEAARAGEAGRGFAVVADQVSVLAAQSSEAAKDSTALIESSVSAVERGMIIADETAKQLENAVEGSKEITEKVNQIATASEEQSEAVVQINTGIEHINDVVRNNSANSEECAASSLEMAQQAEILNSLIREFNVRKF